MTEDSDVELEGVDLEEEEEEEEDAGKGSDAGGRDDDEPTAVKSERLGMLAVSSCVNAQKDAAFEEARRAQRERLEKLKSTESMGETAEDQRERRLTYLMAQSEVFAHFMEESSANTGSGPEF